MRMTRIQTLAGLLFGAAGVALAGCENPTSQADKVVTEKVSQAEATSKDPAKLVVNLDAAGTTPNASPAAKSEVKLRQAHGEIQIGDALVESADRNETEIAHLVGLAKALGGEMSNINVTIDGLQKRSPDNLLKAVDQASTAARGASETSTWAGADEASGVPSRAMVDAQKSKLQSQIDQMTKDRADLDRKQKEATRKQLDESAKSQKSSGEAARAAGLAAAAAKRDAANAFDDGETLDRQLVLLKDQLAVQEARSAALTEADTAFTARKEQINASWAELKKQIELYQSKNKAIVDAGGAPALSAVADATPTTEPTTSGSTTVPSTPQDLTGLAVAIKDLATRADHDRDEALEHYKLAAADLTAAQASAAEVVKMFDKRKRESVGEKDTAAWDNMMGLFTTSNYDIELARLDMRIARVQEDRADRLAMVSGLRKELAPVLEKAGLTMPPALAEMPADEVVADLRKQGDESYGKADEVLGKVIEERTPPQAVDNQPVAKQIRIAEKYLRSQYAFHAGDSTQGQSNLSAAKSGLEEIKDSMPAGAYLPPDLADIVRVVKAPTPLAPAASAGGNIFTGAPAPATTNPTTDATAPAPATAPADTTPPTTAPSDATPPATPPADGTTPPTAPTTPPADSTTPPTAPTTPPADSAPPTTPPTTPPAPGGT